jgi:hypothetical protein
MSKKYKFKLGETVYAAKAKKYYTEKNTKQRQGVPLKVVSRLRQQDGSARYVAQSETGMLTFHQENLLTNKKERVIGWIVPLDNGEVEVVYDATKLPNQENIVTVLGVE